jgi:hypothetical protein
VQELGCALDSSEVVMDRLAFDEADWFGWTSIFISGEIRLGRTLVNSLLKLRIRLMGLKSLTKTSTFFFQCRVM